MLCVFANTELRAQLRLPAILSDNMLLQAAADVRLWGWGDPQDIIRVSPSWAAKVYRAKVDQHGRWALTIKTPKASSSAVSLQFASNNGNLLVSNILLGEVWLCGGQSNMDFPIAKSKGWRTGILNEAEEMKDADYPEIRFFHVAQQLSPAQELDDCAGEWKAVTPESITDFSAIAFFYGRRLHQELHRPIGLIQSTWGGTHAESWTKMAVMQSNTLYKPLLDEQALQVQRYRQDSIAYESAMALHGQHPQSDAAAKAPKKPQNPNNNKSCATLWNAMIHPLLPYTIKGVIWYQGESNAIRANDYSEVFENLIGSWRQEWQQGTFPFYFVQIAPHYKQPPEIREAQRRVSLRYPNVGMAVITDAGDSTDIHPRDKRIPAERLAALALAKTYGRPVLHSGPVFKQVRYADGKAIARFDYVQGGLSGQQGLPIRGFEIAGADGEYVPAEARAEGGLLILRAPQVVDPKKIRYGWGNFFRANLTNASGIPASPFLAQ